MRLILTTVID
jgi:hypothetical protein